MENFDENAYEILFMGPAADTAEERERVIQGLQTRFNISRDRAIQLVQRAPIVVKRGVTQKEGDRYVEAFHSIGAMARVRQLSHFNDVKRESGTTPYRPGEEGEYCPWEDMERLGFFQAFLTTLKEVFLSPAQFYRRMPTSRGLTNPLIFALILGVFGGALALTWQQIFMLRLGQFQEISPIHLVGITIALPLIVLVTLSISSVIVHLCLTVVGGNRRGFEATFRVIAYSAATEIFSLIPFIGSLITFIYKVVIAIIGLRESHGTGTGRAILAVFLPFIVMVVFFVVLVISLFYKLSEFL